MGSSMNLDLEDKKIVALVSASTLWRLVTCNSNVLSAMSFCYLYDISTQTLKCSSEHFMVGTTIQCVTFYEQLCNITRNGMKQKIFPHRQTTPQSTKISKT